jgi:hypothetical protein
MLSVVRSFCIVVFLLSVYAAKGLAQCQMVVFKLDYSNTQLHPIHSVGILFMIQCSTTS